MNEEIKKKNGDLPHDSVPSSIPPPLLKNNKFNMVDRKGFEPLTPCVQSRYSSQLS